MSVKFNITPVKGNELLGWDAGNLQKEYYTLQQTVNWAQFLSRYYDAKPYFIYVKDASSKIVAALFFYKIGRYPEIYHKKPCVNFIKSAVNYFDKCLSWTDGPIFFSDNDREDIVLEILGFIENIAIKERIKTVHDVTFPVMLNDRSSLEEVFFKKGYTKKTWATYILNLRNNEKNIWGSFKGKIARTPVRKAKSMKVQFKECNKDDIPVYFLCELEHGRLKRLAVQPKMRFDILWETLSPIGGYKIFAAMHKGRPIAFMPLRCFNKTVHIVKPVQSNTAFDNKIPAGDFLIWECIKWAKEHGFWYFDFSGVSPSPKTKEEKGIRFFKKKWGGDYYEYGVFSKRLR